MTTIALELTVACKLCDTALPINALVPAVTCARCERALTIAPAQWTKILHAPVTDAKELAEGEERHAKSSADDGSVVSVRFVRTGARCTPCGAAVAPSDVACAACGKTLLVRPGPEGSGVRSVIGEEAAQLGLAPAEATSKPIDLACSHCGAALHVDGARRVVPCAHCNGEVRLADDVWSRLHPVRAARRFYAVLEAAEATPAAFSFHAARVALRDGRGNVYVAGRLRAREHVEGSVLDNSGVPTEEAAWSYDPDLRLRWVRRFKTLGEAEAIALLPGEASLFVNGGSDGSVTLDAATGAPIKQKPPLGLVEAEVVQAEADGTFVVGSSGVVGRLSAGCDRLPLFPEEKVESPGFFTRVFGTPAAPKARVAGKNALVLPSGELVVLVAVEGAPLTLVRYDRKGEKLSAQATEIPDDACSDSPMQCDGDDLYVLAAQRLWRVSREGARELVTPLAIDGPIDAFVVLPRGDLWLFGPAGTVRRAGRADGAAYTTEPVTSPSGALSDRLGGPLQSTQGG